MSSPHPGAIDRHDEAGRNPPESAFPNASGPSQPSVSTGNRYSGSTRPRPQRRSHSPAAQTPGRTAPSAEPSLSNAFVALTKDRLNAARSLQLPKSMGVATTARTQAPPAVVFLTAGHRHVRLHQHFHHRALVVDEGVEGLLHQVLQRNSDGDERPLPRPAAQFQHPRGRSTAAMPTRVMPVITMRGPKRETFQGTRS
jgi:hypothetical protein